MIEQIIFTILSIMLFVYMFYKMMKYNENEYIVILIIEALGLIIDFVGYISGIGINIFFKVITYIMAILLPLFIIILERKGVDVINRINVLKVDFYLFFKNDKKAKDILINLTEKNPKNYMAHKKLAEIYEQEGGIRRAIDEYVLCIDVNKKDYNSYYKIATYLNDLDKKDEAIEMLQNLTNKKPDYLDASLTLGNLLIEKERYKEAANIYESALKYNEINYELIYSLGIVYTMLNDFDKAKEYYERAAELNSLIYNPKYNLAQIALLYKELDVAEQYFLQTIQDEDLEADSYFELARIALIKGEKEKAIKYANTAIDCDSKKISEKIKKDTLFMTIMTKISIPFNLEEKEPVKKLSEKEDKAKKHLEETTDITRNMGYNRLRNNDISIELDNQKERE